MTHQELQKKIKQASRSIGKTWPLYSFVTANPLSGYEDLPFSQALGEAADLWGAEVLPGGHFIRKAWQEGKIDADKIEILLKEAGKTEVPEFYLKLIEHQSSKKHLNGNHELDVSTVKWLSLFLDEGMAAWPMPFKDMGFYTAWRLLVIYDNEFKKKLGNTSIPKTPEEALSRVLENFSQEDQLTIFERHLAALPGWAGFIKYRNENNTQWNQEYPLDLLQYLAVRLWMARCMRAQILPEPPQKRDPELLELEHLWLKAWEQTWQSRFFDKIKSSHSSKEDTEISRPDAQLVFCLDSRSEALRRLLEQYGNYETFGSAGAFGLPMDYRHPESGLITKSSPAMIPSQYLIHEEPAPQKENQVREYKKESKKISAYKYFLKRLKNILPSAFGFVEGSGFYYGGFMLLRIFRPKIADQLTLYNQGGYEEIYEPHICDIHRDSTEEISTEEKAAIVKGVFDSCGWRTFAPLVVFTGHASHSANNPFSSSLDCGACAGNPGKRNARTLARLANSKGVQDILQKKYGIHIPEDTLFIAAEHTTSTDKVVLFDSNVPPSHQTILLQLKKDLVRIQQDMTSERLAETGNAQAMAKVKATSWSESRPEYGLSGHAGYIIGPRTLTENGVFPDCFLSSYDWKIDEKGSILKGIMQGPLLVCQWISNHYYFSTVDNDVFGGGSKITLNITGKHGAVQGNGSDLKMGLPLQSLMSSDEDVVHNPLRLTTLIQAPRQFITDILDQDPKLKSLIENEWIYLFVMDPNKQNSIERYLSA